MNKNIDKSYNAFLNFLQKTSKEDLNYMIEEINNNRSLNEPTVEEYFDIVGKYMRNDVLFEKDIVVNKESGINYKFSYSQIEFEKDYIASSERNDKDNCGIITAA